jgi:hypothetical protein
MKTKSHKSGRGNSRQSKLAQSNGAVPVTLEQTMPCPEQLIEARYVRPARLFLHFADGLEGTWTFRQLELDMSNMKVTTIKASASGTIVKVKSKWGENVLLDSSSLRVLIDPEYAEKIEQKLNGLAKRIGL